MKRKALWALFGVVMLEVSAGAQQSSMPGGQMAATAVIVLTQEFCTVEVKRGVWAFGGEVFQAGRLLCPAAEEAARNSFQRVIRMETAPKPEDAGGHLILIPRYVDMEATTTATLVGTVTQIEKRKMALLVEWTATDPSGKILWAQTVEGDARKGTGVKNISHRKLLENATRDLVANSTEAMEKSQEIQQFVKTPAGK